MARYIQDAGINQPLDVVSEAMEQYLYRNRYIRTEWKDELVYMSADGDVKGNRYLIWSYMSGILHIEAWMKGSFGNETGLTGAGSKKRAYKESIDNLIEALRQPVKDEYTRSDTVYQPPKPAQSYTPPASKPVQPYTPPASKPVQSYTPPASKPVQPYTPPVQKTAPSYTARSEEKPYAQQNTSGNFKPTQPNAFEPYVPDYQKEKEQKAMRGLVFGAAAVFMSFVISIAGLIFAVMGLQFCKEGMGSSMEDKAKIGKVLCIVALVWCGMRVLYYVFVLMLGLLAMF